MRNGKAELKDFFTVLDEHNLLESFGREWTKQKQERPIGPLVGFLEGIGVENAVQGVIPWPTDELKAWIEVNRAWREWCESNNVTDWRD